MGASEKVGGKKKGKLCDGCQLVDTNKASFAFLLHLIPHLSPPLPLPCPSLLILGFSMPSRPQWRQKP